MKIRVPFIRRTIGFATGVVSLKKEILQLKKNYLPPFKIKVFYTKNIGDKFGSVCIYSVYLFLMNISV